MKSSDATQTQESKEWPFAVFMTVLLLIALVGAMLNPSCHRQSDHPDSHLESPR